MRAALVTGATGFLGAHLCEALVRAGEPVRALARSASARLTALGVELVEGSVLEPADVGRALAGCDRVYHLAGLVSRRAADAPAMYRLHVEGTRLVCEAAAAARARVVLASTSGTIAVSERPEALDEEAPAPLGLLRDWPYYLSKVYQERAALELARARGLELVVLNPSLLLGPGDDRLSSTRDVLRFLQRRVPLVPTGGVSFVDVRDVAATALAAMARGRAGERYLLGGPNWTARQLLERLGRVADLSPPRLRIPARARRLGALAARLVEDAYRAAGRADPPIDRMTAEMAERFWWLDASKARRELGFAPRDPGETLLDTVRDLRARFFDTPAEASAEA